MSLCKTVRPGLLYSSKLELSSGSMLTNANLTEETREEQETAFLKAFPTLGFIVFCSLFFSSVLFFFYCCIYQLSHFSLFLFLPLLFECRALHICPSTYESSSLELGTLNKSLISLYLDHGPYKGHTKAKRARSDFLTPGLMSGAYCYTRSYHTPSPLRKMTSGQATISMLLPANCRTSWGRWWHLHL